ncbi:hypothetical protein F6V25_07920 [Oryzomonas japonica]|uniref:Uncharacterized protein n=1 Tax=Oryzomonas japonica TaxID=2603858 RepID=A0A7J4ZR45_9BACT|nr:hypothetical protein [Oryzomonas japonica]KAB0665640.1 hypothetical protein F6V25_07920 [Oryzomonas japonica]
MSAYQAKVFQAALEIALRAVLPQSTTLANVVDRLSAVSPSKSQAGMYRNEDWASDFLSCLPDDPDQARLIVLCYVPSYVCGCNVIHLSQERCDDCGEWPEPYRMLPVEGRKAGGVARSFWGRVQQRRLFGRGLRIVEG